jgi:hypothetical protein
VAQSIPGVEYLLVEKSGERVASRGWVHTCTPALQMANAQMTAVARPPVGLIAIPPECDARAAVLMCLVSMSGLVLIFFFA